MTLRPTNICAVKNKEVHTVNPLSYSINSFLEVSLNRFYYSRATKCCDGEKSVQCRVVRCAILNIVSELQCRIKLTSLCCNVRVILFRVRKITKLVLFDKCDKKLPFKSGVCYQMNLITFLII